MAGYIKPCPLCGRSAEVVSPVEGVWNVGCGRDADTCGLVLFGGKKGETDTKKGVVAHWNNRDGESNE